MENNQKSNNWEKEIEQACQSTMSGFRKNLPEAVAQGWANLIRDIRISDQQKLLEEIEKLKSLKDHLIESTIEGAFVIGKLGTIANIKEIITKHYNE